MGIYAFDQVAYVCPVTKNAYIMPNEINEWKSLQYCPSYYNE